MDREEFIASMLMLGMRQHRTLKRLWYLPYRDPSKVQVSVGSMVVRLQPDGRDGCIRLSVEGRHNDDLTFEQALEIMEQQLCQPSTN